MLSLSSIARMPAYLSISCLFVACAAPQLDTAFEDKSFHENVVDNCPSKDELSKVEPALKKNGITSDGRTNLAVTFGNKCSYLITADEAYTYIESLEDYLAFGVDVDPFISYPQAQNFAEKYIDNKDEFTSKKLHVLVAMGTGKESKDSRIVIFTGNSISVNDVRLGE